MAVVGPTAMGIANLARVALYWYYQYQMSQSQ